MKKLLSIFVILICAVSLNAQQKINGFGKLQLGVSINDISELSNSKFVNEENYISKVYGNTSSSSYESILDTT